MAKCCKRLKKAYSLFDKDNSYTILEAIDVLMKYKAECPVKFDESVDVAIRLGVDTNKGDQNIKSFVELPHGNGKKVLAQVLYAVTFDVFVRHTNVNHFVFKHIS